LAKRIPCFLFAIKKKFVCELVMNRATVGSGSACGMACRGSNQKGPRLVSISQSVPYLFLIYVFFLKKEKLISKNISYSLPIF
jgi:hypothetical protein